MTSIATSGNGNETEGRHALFVSSLILGAIVGSVGVFGLGGNSWADVTASSGAIAAWLALCLLLAVVNPLAAGVAVALAERLDRIAFPSYRPWSLERRLVSGAFWPLVLMFFVVVAPFALVADCCFGP